MRRLDIIRQTRFEVKKDIHTRDFPQYLAARLSTTRTIAERLVAQGAVRVNGEPADPHHMPRRGDVVDIEFPQAFTAHMLPTAMPLSILHEDDRLIAVDKPAGIIVHPARGHMTADTILNGLFHYLQQKDQAAEPPYLAVSHRIDQDTSGIVVYARDRASHQHVSAQFQERRAQKTYLAIVDGIPATETFTIRGAIGPDPVREGLWAVLPDAAPGAKAAETVFRVLTPLANAALVEARPLTGRTHQIRLHLYAAGHPICGDRDYHPQPEKWRTIKRNCNCITQHNTHPTNAAPHPTHAPLPADMAGLIQALHHP